MVIAPTLVNPHWPSDVSGLTMIYQRTSALRSLAIAQVVDGEVSPMATRVA